MIILGMGKHEANNLLESNNNNTRFFKIIMTD